MLWSANNMCHRFNEQCEAQKDVLETPPPTGSNHLEIAARFRHDFLTFSEQCGPSVGRKRLRDKNPFWAQASRKKAQKPLKTVQNCWKAYSEPFGTTLKRSGVHGRCTAKRTTKQRFIAKVNPTTQTISREWILAESTSQPWLVFNQLFCASPRQSHHRITSSNRFIIEIIHSGIRLVMASCLLAVFPKSIDAEKL